MAAPSTSGSLSSGNPPNPTLAAYEDFVRRTPFVTRAVVWTQVSSWVLSFFIDLSFALANVPRFTVLGFELYRIILSPLLCDGLFSLLITLSTVVDIGRRTEASVGSTAFGYELLWTATLVNVAFVAICFLASGMTGDRSWLLSSSSGFWIVFFALISKQCAKAPPGSTRKLIFYTVPTIYYPAALLLLITFFSGFQISYLISAAVGYANGHGHLDQMDLGSVRYKSWEENALSGLAARDGWVGVNSASGGMIWSEGDGAESSSRGGGMFSGLLSGNSSTSAQAETRPSDQAGESASSPSSSFPSSGGRTLGSPAKRSGIDPRQARLQAIERRSGGNDNGSNSGDVV